MMPKWLDYTANAVFAVFIVALVAALIVDSAAFRIGLLVLAAMWLGIVLGRR